MYRRLKGIIKFFSNERGFGFLHPLNEGGEADISIEYFIHFSSINMKGFKTLSANQFVTFTLKETPKGIQAVDIDLIE